MKSLKCVLALLALFLACTFCYGAIGFAAHYGFTRLYDVEHVELSLNVGLALGLRQRTVDRRAYREGT